jgi:PBP1b-binding outer membrane lipoprotein LpoB
MRTILTAALAFAILFMVGCGTTAEEKATMKAQGDQITTLQKNLTALQTSAAAMDAKTNMMDGFLKAQFPKVYGVVDTTKKAAIPAPTTTKTTTTKTTTTKKGTGAKK